MFLFYGNKFIPPSYCSNRIQLNLFLDAIDNKKQPKIIISESEKNNWDDEPDKYVVYKNLIIQNYLYKYGLNEKYFNTNIENKNVYCHKLYYGIGLPLQFNSGRVYYESYVYYDKKYHIYKVANKDNDIYANSSDRTITKINFIEEKTLGELYENCWKYELNISTNEYERLPEETAKNNLIKYILYKTIFEYCGNPYDRVADYGRLILFILNKLPLTEDEKNILQPLLNYSKNISELTDVIEREKCIQRMVNDAKTDIRKFLSNT